MPTTTPARCAQAAAGRSLNQEKARFSVRQFGPQPVLYGDTEVPASLIAELQNSRKEALERLGGKKAQMMWVLQRRRLQRLRSGVGSSR